MCPGMLDVCTRLRLSDNQIMCTNASLLVLQECQQLSCSQSSVFVAHAVHWCKCNCQHEHALPGQRTDLSWCPPFVDAAPKPEHWSSMRSSTALATSVMMPGGMAGVFTYQRTASHSAVITIYKTALPYAASALHSKAGSCTRGMPQRHKTAQRC